MTSRTPRELQIAAIVLVALFLAATIAGPSPIAVAAGQSQGATKPNPTFYRDVVPILQSHCQSCHRAGGISTLPLETFEQAQRKAAAIANAVVSRTMPPWFADPKIGHFSNDPSLTGKEIAAITNWSESGAPAGDPHDAPPPLHWNVDWNIAQPDKIVQMPVAVKLPAQGQVEYTYEIVPTGFTEDKWIQEIEVHPSSPEHVHHAVVYIRPPDSKWLRGAPVGMPFANATLADEKIKRDTRWTDSDVLLVYAPGSSPDEWPSDMAKFIPAGSDLVFQIHYTTNGTPAEDQSSVGLIFAKSPPPRRVLTLQLTNDKFEIPPGADDFRVEVHGTVPNDCTLLSLFPHMHLRGKRFEYNIVEKNGRLDPLLRVNYHFHWQMSYRLAEPLALKAGTMLQAVAWYDNSAKNPHNPDPTRAVSWGDQTTDEMMVGFFDVAVPANVDKQRFFIRSATQ
jgi:Copper type II ascorbate-dependent monooxygenase, C-terminal domain